MQNNEAFQELTDEQLEQVNGGAGLINVPNVDLNVPVALGTSIQLPLVGGNIALGVEAAPSLSLGNK